MVTAGSSLNKYLKDPVGFMFPFILGLTKYLPLPRVYHYGSLGEQPLRNLFMSSSGVIIYEFKTEIVFKWQKNSWCHTAAHLYDNPEWPKRSLNNATIIIAPRTTKWPQFSKSLQVTSERNTSISALVAIYTIFFSVHRKLCDCYTSTLWCRVRWTDLKTT